MTDRLRQTDNAPPLMATKDSRVDDGPRGSGFLAATVVALLFSVGSFYFSQQSVQENIQGLSPRNHELSDVDPAELAAALKTLNNTSDVAQDWNKQNNRCEHHLAWVALSSEDMTDGTIRVKSGPYFSPILPTGKMPGRVAIPYPEPYETGHGMIEILHSGGAVTMALTPRVSIPQAATNQPINVTWRPHAPCMKPHE